MTTMMTEPRPKECVPSSSSWTMYGQLIRKKKRQDRLVLAIQELQHDDDVNHHHDHHHHDEEEEEQPRRFVGTASSEDAIINIATNVSIDRNHNYDFLYLFSILKLEVRPVSCVVQTKGDSDDDEEEKRHLSSSSSATMTNTTTSLEAVTVELVQCAPDPSAVALVLQGIGEGRFPVEVMGTLSLSSSSSLTTTATTTNTTTTILKSRQEARDILNNNKNMRARRIAIAGLVRLLQGKEAYKPPRMRNPHIKQFELQILEHLYHTGQSGSAGWHLLEPKETTFGTTTSTSTSTTTIMSHRDGDDMNNNKSQMNHNFQPQKEEEQLQRHQDRYHHDVLAQAVAVGTITAANTPPQAMPAPLLPLNLPDECLMGNHKIVTTYSHKNGTTTSSTMMMNRAERRGDRVDYILSKKLPQVRWMTQRVRQMHSSTPNGDGETTSAPKHIVDVGGGRGDLATALALAFPTTLVTVVDKNRSSLNAAQEYARQLNCHLRMQFIHADMVDFVQKSDNDDHDDDENGATTRRMIQKEDQPPVDLVVALHACGDLSDLALAFAAKVNAAFVICPCCYTKRYNFPQFTPPWNKYCAPTTDYCHTLGRLAELNDRPQVSRLAMKLINSMRLQSMKEKTTTAMQQENKKTYKVGLEEYDSACSQRNLVLVGVR